MADFEDHSNPDPGTTEVEPRKEPSASDSIPEQRTNKSSTDPCAGLEQVIALASAENVPSPILAPNTPSDPLQTLIQANRYPPGQRTLFAAIDALSPELNRRDAVMGLNRALRLLQGALEHALDDPTVIQQHQHVRNKLMLEYMGLSESEQVEGKSIDALIEEIKGRIASRWRVEAMEKQKDIS
ncbi:hypothetical protein MBLNU13_g04879t1 [Cladosporium sp. NU13]